MSWPPTGKPIHATYRKRQRRDAGQIRRRREDVAQVHLVRIGLGTDRKCRRGGGRRKQHVDAAVEHLPKVVRDERAHFLRLPVVRVVVAGGQHIRAEQDAARHFAAEAVRARVGVHLAQRSGLRARAVPNAVESREVRRRLGRRDDVVGRDGEVGVRQRHVTHRRAQAARNVLERGIAALANAGVERLREVFARPTDDHALERIAGRQPRSRRPATSALVESYRSRPAMTASPIAASSTVRPNTPT